VAGRLVWHLGVGERPTPKAELPTTAKQKNSDIVSSEEADTSNGLWDRPHAGEPISVQYVPADVQALIRVNIANLTQHAEGERILRSLGPDFESMFTHWSSKYGVQRELIDQVTVCLLPQGSTLPQVVTILQLVSEAKSALIPAYAKINEQRVVRMAASGIWFPPDEDQILVCGPFDDLVALAESKGADVQLRREFAELLRSSHDTDQVTIIANANFLSDEASGLFPASRLTLLAGLTDLWGDEAQAVSMHVQLNAVAVAELRVVPRAELPPRILAARIQQRLRYLPTRVSDYIGRLQLDPYWQRLAVRFPAMVRFLTDQTRVVVDDPQIVMSAALPVEAVHNLLLASELSLASSVIELPASPTHDRAQWDLQDLLAATISIHIAQDSLESAIQLVQRHVQEELPGLSFPFTIEILGHDLEEEGITRNQQIRDFRQQEKSVAEILTALVMAANPVKTVVHAAEAEQRLVWVPSPTSPPKILITTRKGAETEGLFLPPVFVGE
jgi:hypothetical protein